MIRRIAWLVLVIATALVFYGIEYWSLTTGWDANPAFAAGAGAVVAILLFGRTLD